MGGERERVEADSTLAALIYNAPPQAVAEQESEAVDATDNFYRDGSVADALMNRK